MRLAITFVIALSSACATTSTGGRVNVATVRSEINETIKSTTHDRSVTSMGKASADKAVVFTTGKTGVRAEETWTKSAAGWKLESAAPLEASISVR